MNNTATKLKDDKMSLFFDPKNDVAFRRLFGRKTFDESTIDLLNTILNLEDERRITHITHLNTHLLPESVELRESIVDILCEDQRKHKYIIELQILKPEHFDKRVLYYASKTYVAQLVKGDKYPKLNKVHLIGILNHQMFDYTDNYKTEHIITDKVTHDHTFTDFEFHIIELPKFKKKKEDECTTALEKWVYFFKYADRLKEIPENIPVPLSNAYKAMEQFNWTKAERDLYERAELAIADLQSIKNMGKKEGRKEGRKEGEKNKAISIAKSLLNQKVDMNIISQSTGLSIEELKKLT